MVLLSLLWLLLMMVSILVPIAGGTNKSDVNVFNSPCVSRVQSRPVDSSHTFLKKYVSSVVDYSEPICWSDGFEMSQRTSSQQLEDRCWEP
jgi:hypothetical protein